MVGYVESLTDPSYRGQILTLTYPLIGNYGVPDVAADLDRFESDRIQVRGLVVANYVDAYSHSEAAMSLGQWLHDQDIVGITGVDTRLLTMLLREKGTMLGRIVVDERPQAPIADPNRTDLVAEVTCREPYVVGARAADAPHVVVVDCGCKRSIIACLRDRGCRLTVVPYTHDISALACDGVMLSNGPGDPTMCGPAIAGVGKLLARPDPVPVVGICLGCQIMALAAGARTFKLPYGHRSQNKPVRLVGTEQCRITSQNHGYAIDPESLPDGWEVWFTNLDDGTVEGVRHLTKPFFAVQFHPEASPGPTDSAGFFDDFMEAMRHE
jgi:carbamoyl-phosphate synthase small subunit